MASNYQLSKNPLTTWKVGFHENYRRAYSGNLENYTRRVHSVNPRRRMRIITKLEQNFRKLFKTRPANLPNYIYRGLHTGPTTVNNKFGYSSWTTSLQIAKNFGRGMYGSNRRGTILRLNTKLLNNIPVLNLRNRGEAEIVLPPIQVVLNRESLERVNNGLNTYFVPVKNVILNSRFYTQPPPVTTMNRFRKFFRRA